MKLLKAVSSNARSGVGFLGCAMPRGEMVDPAVLQPTPEYPEPPILLEFIESEGKTGRQRIYAYLWQLDRKSRSWHILAEGRGRKWPDRILSAAVRHLPVINESPEGGSTASSRPPAEPVLLVPATPTTENIKKHWAKTLSAIDRSHSNGYAFVGKFVKPGQKIGIGELRPSAEFPEVPIVVECLVTTDAFDGEQSLARLWRYDGERSEWRELAQADGDRWAKPLIEEALKYLPEGKNATAADHAARLAKNRPQDLWANIKTYIDQETERASPLHRLEVLEFIETEVRREISIRRLDVPEAIADGGVEMAEGEDGF